MANKHNNFLSMTKILSWLLVMTILLAGCQTVLPGETTPPQLSNPTDYTVSTEATEPSASESATDPSTEATEPPTSEPSTEPTTAPTTPPTAEPTVPPTTEPTVPPAVEPTVPGSSFEVHFIDVGQADAILVLCDGKAMLIDGGNKADSNVMFTYLKKHNISHLDYVIGTHGHEDHIGGIPGALQYATVGTAYCSVTSYNSQAFRNFVSALNNRGASITIPQAGLTFKLGSATCTILAVDPKADDPNNTSIVMRIVYGETSFLFTGDAEREVEQTLLNSGVELKSTVLKVGHHGSNSSTTYPFLREVMPEYAVICVGKGNSYGHPTANTLSRLRDADVTTFRTDMQGDIICVSDGKSVTFTVSRNANAAVYAGID